MSYINKEQAIDLIESMIADKRVAFNPHKLAMALKDMESVEIVRCKDCIHCADDWNGNEPMFTCELARCCESVYPDDFCSYGEKQVTGKLESVEKATSEGEESTMGQPKSKLESDTISRQAAIEALTGWQTDPTDEEIMRTLKALPPVEDMGEVSDGYHTFNQLYHQRAVLFATIVNQNKDKAWKSWKHEDGKFCFDKDGEWFIVGVDTPEGSYTYHYEKKYWDMFDCEELERGKHWDGHTEEDVTRLLSLPPVEPKPVCEDAISRKWVLNEIITKVENDDSLTDEQKGSLSVAKYIIRHAPPVEPKRPKGEWVSCSEPPKDRRNVFLAHGTNDFKSCCIGHYEQGMGWYEDRNFFAKPIYDCKYWCDIPELPDLGNNQFGTEVSADMRGDSE